jgi:hypothetical protein
VLSPPPHKPPAVDAQQRRRRGVSDDAERERRRKHAATQSASRRRSGRGEMLCQILVDSEMLDWLVFFNELPDHGGGRTAVSAAVGKLLRRAIGALLREARKKS